MNRRAVVCVAMLITVGPSGLRGLASLSAGDVSAGPLLLVVGSVGAVLTACYWLVGDPSGPEPGWPMTIGAVLGATLALAGLLLGLS